MGVSSYYFLLIIELLSTNTLLTYLIQHIENNWYFVEKCKTIEFFMENLQTVFLCAVPKVFFVVNGTHFRNNTFNIPRSTYLQKYLLVMYVNNRSADPIRASTFSLNL